MHVVDSECPQTPDLFNACMVLKRSRSIIILQICGLIVIKLILPVVVHDCVESMSNSDDSAVTELTPDGFLNEVISFQVHSSCGFIQH